jgi:stage II sporulation protein D
MKKVKKESFFLNFSIAIVSCLVLIMFLIPILLVRPLVANEVKANESTANESQVIAVYLAKEQLTISVPIEEYVIGVVAAEMPAHFELEALKAQAIAARTYLVHKLRIQNKVVTNTVNDQVYISKEQMKEKWGIFTYRQNLKKISRAVNETRGIIATYQGQPIDAMFFSTSNGYTEDSENYWQGKLPYLRSVASPWDQELSPKYHQQRTFSIHQFYEALGMKQNRNDPRVMIVQRYPSGRVMAASVDGQNFTGRQIRELLELQSSDFNWKVDKNKVYIITKGYGHGVGMSQWGAQGLAQMGKKATEILRYYYRGINLESIERI